MAELRRSKRNVKADIQYVDPNAPQVETDQATLDELREAALNEQPIDSARRVFEYINRGDIASEEREKFMQQQEEKQREEEEEEARRVKPIKFFDLLLRDAANRSALHTLVVVTALMCILPVGTFYFGKEILFSSYAENWKLTFSGFLAVVMVNVVSLGFGLYAYYEPEDPESETERLARLQGDSDRTDAWVRDITRGRMVAKGKFADDVDAPEVKDDKSINLDQSSTKTKNKKR